MQKIGIFYLVQKSLNVAQVIYKSLFDITDLPDLPNKCSHVEIENL
jgi:hypothetical protein